MRPHVLQMAGIYPPIQKMLEDAYEVARYDRAEDRAALLRRLAPECQIVVTNGGRGVEAAVLEQLPKLKLVACFGVGVDAIDVRWCREHGVAVTNTPDVLTEDVADMAFGLLIATVRRIALGDRFVRAGTWLKAGMALTDSLQRKRVGIVGMGRIGQAIARRCVAFNCEIGYHGPNRKPVEFRYHDDLLELARWADVLVTACPGGPATAGLVSRAALEALGPDGYFVNIARGSVVDQDALVELLGQRRLAGAGLDVFDDEPNVPEALLTMDHVVLQPHQGSATFPTRQAMGQLVLDNVAAFVGGRPLVTPV